MTVLPSISSHERYWNAEVARRRPDLVSQEAATLDRMIERYLDLAGSTFGTVAHVLPDRARVLRHLIDRHGDEQATEDPADAAVRHLSEQVGSERGWSEAQVDRLAALIASHPGACPQLMATGDGTVVVSFGPRRGDGAYVLELHGGSRWVTPRRYAA
ncbi:MAG TPA: hypothetical protein VGI67_21270 [Thermoleophilaceae bacterium]|jgi:hypothetical protein